MTKIEQQCSKLGIKFLRLKPRNSWEELYKKYDMPTKLARWCDSKYKCDCERQLKEWLKQQNYHPIAYIEYVLTK